VVVGFQGGQGSGEEQGEFSLLPSTLFFAKVIESMDLADERFSLLFVLARFASSPTPEGVSLLPLSSSAAHLAWFSFRLRRPSQTFGRNRGAG
jgi:hypothetical protein